MNSLEGAIAQDAIPHLRDGKSHFGIAQPEVPSQTASESVSSGMPKPNKHFEALRKLALSFPETVEGSSCNKLSYKAGNKAFLYLGESDDDGSYNLRFKLTDSFSEAEKLAAKNATAYQPGSAGWVYCEFPASKAPPKGLMERWLEESYRALVPKKLLPLLDGKSPAKKAAKK